MPARVTYITDPACAVSWAVEPMVRRLMADFGDDLSFRYVMGGLARDWGPDDHAALMSTWLQEAARSGMPFDPLIWREAPLRSSYPASMAMKAATDQGPAAAEAYLRSLREGIFAFRRKLDTADALVDEARRAGLDGDRFRRDLESNAVVEAFAADLEIARDVPDAARAAGQAQTTAGKERVAFPTMIFEGQGGERHGVYGAAAYEDYRRAAEAAGAVAVDAPRLGVVDALRRFGRMATREVEEVTGLRGPRAEAELWALARDFEVKPTRVLTGTFWEPA